ncbi:MAG: hypothetical protein ACRCXZ_05455 [Patescibacteria group bacterium]
MLTQTNKSQLETQFENEFLADDGSDSNKLIIITGEVLFEAIQDPCWDKNPTNNKFAEVFRDVLTVKIGIYLTKIKSNNPWLTIQQSMTAYLKSKNISLSPEYLSRFYKVLERFEPKAQNKTSD